MLKKRTIRDICILLYGIFLVGPTLSALLSLNENDLKKSALSIIVFIIACIVTR